MVGNRPVYTHLKEHFEFEELEAINSENGRVYKTPKGDLYPSVTTVLGAQKNKGLEQWRKFVGDKEADRIMHHAATRGTALHEAVERYCDNEEDYFAPGEMPHVKAMFRSIEPELHNIGIIAAQEVPLYSDFLGLAGRVDMIGEWKGVPSIIDFKTSSRRKKRSEIKNYFMQATAYAHMFEERTNVAVDRLVIIMAVENDPNALVFVDDDRIQWVDPLVKAIQEYSGKKVG